MERDKHGRFRAKGEPLTLKISCRLPKSYAEKFEARGKDSYWMREVICKALDEEDS